MLMVARGQGAPPVTERGMARRSESKRPEELDLRTMPGHLARRVQQLAVALFAEEIGELNLTPVQYSSLQAVARHPGIDQKTLARGIGYDTSTIGGVIDRLEARGLVVRSMDERDRRVRLVSLTASGRATLAAATPRMLSAQARLLEPLARAERREFMRLMTRLIEANEGLSTIPARE
jgi:DNA-binding MarR family transcriptional regulator